MSLYTEVLAAGCEMDSYESDLYVKHTEKAWRIMLGASVVST